jgi:hypothetical protein
MKSDTDSSYNIFALSRSQLRRFGKFNSLPGGLSEIRLDIQT